MPFFSKTTIRTTLMLVVGIMSILLISLTVRDLSQATSRWHEANRLTVLSTIDRHLFQALLQTRLERGSEVATVLADAPADDAAINRIADYRRISEDGFAQSLAALTALRTDGLPPLVAHLTSTHDAVIALRAKIDTAFHQPKSNRVADLAPEIMSVEGAFLDAVSRVSDLLESTLKMSDPTVDQILSVKRSAWAMRSFGGLIAVRIENAAATGQNWTVADMVGAGEDAGRVAYAWTLVSEAGTRSDTPKALAEAIRQAGRYFVGPMADQRKSLIATLSSPEKLAMSVAELQKRNTEELTLSVTVVNEALTAMIDRAASQQFKALRTLAISAVLLAFTVLLTAFVLTIVSRRIAFPLRRMTTAMQRLADGDMAIDIPDRSRQDEIGCMAKAVQVFKENAIQAHRLADERAATAVIREAHAMTLESLALGFDQAVSSVVDIVAGASSAIATSAHTMSNGAEQANGLAMTAAAAAQQTAASVHHVSSAAEELSHSIAEIAHQVEQSSRVSQMAAQEAVHTNATVKGLAESSTKIGDVIKLINDIAAQTNLLALNATIEAARAGDAGKGFAVVAGEVKHLANQTALATDQIGIQINAVQSATQEAVAAIGVIVSRIDELDHIVATIAAAVEEQSAATAEIARNVQQAASGTREISGHIGSVRSAVGDNGIRADDVLSSARSLSREAAGLKDLVIRFLSDVRAA
ncbi:MAG: methyl-accepting chemotaxis protein [Azospirillaceae bacterium]|nr:methyl-accepting chemotaxis protein [Azospirillaceae bacterium]